MFCQYREPGRIGQPFRPTDLLGRCTLSTGVGGSEPRLSDDKQWWWDGQQWLPASQAPAGQVPPATPFGPTTVPSAPVRAKSGGVPGWLAVVGLLLCTPVGIVLTLFTNWSVKAKAIVIGVILAIGILGGIGIAATSNANSTADVSAITPAAAKSPNASAKSSPAAPPKAQFVTFGSGTLVVGKDVQAGTYRTRHDRSTCYFERLSGFGGTLGEIIANELTGAPAVVTISSSDKGFKSSGCDTWTSDLSPITTSRTSFGAGDMIVGTDIQPGTYQNTPTSHCYWTRVSGFGHTLDQVIANDLTSSQTVVTIAASDKGFSSASCGTWTKIG